MDFFVTASESDGGQVFMDIVARVMACRLQPATVLLYECGLRRKVFLLKPFYKSTGQAMQKIFPLALKLP